MANKLNIYPLSDRVVVKPALGEDKTASGIYIPDSASKEKPMQGEVVAVGPGRWDEDGEKQIPVAVKVGDIVLYSKYSPEEVEVDGETYLIISESSLLAIIN